MAIKLGLDAKRAFNNQSGLGVYSRVIIEELAKKWPNENLILFTTKKKFWSSTLTIVTSSFGALWRSIFIYFDLLKYEIDIYHGLAGELPFILPQKVKTVVTIHDLLFLRFPKDYPWIDRFIYNLKSTYACRRADKIIAVSEVTKNDIIQFYGINSDKIDVIPNSLASEPAIKKERPYSKEYIVCISSFLGRKNQDMLVKAYARIKEKVQFDLIFIGSGKRLYKIKELSKQLNCEENIQFLSGLNDNEKFNYLHHSLFSVYPSRGEGFGIPILESFLCGKPILLSDIAINREVAGEAGIYFRDNDEKDLAENLLKLSIHNNFAELASKRIARFKASTVIYELEKIYFSLIGRKPRI